MNQGRSLMRFSIRYQLLLPLFILLLGVVGISTWTGVASAMRARRQIEADMRNVAHYLTKARFGISANVLESVKLLSGADFVLVDPEARKHIHTLPRLPRELPPATYVVDDWENLLLSPPIDVGGESYLCSGVRLRPERELEPEETERLRKTVYILYPERLWRDALWGAIQPSIVLGLFGGVASVVLATLMSARLARRVQELERRTRMIASGDFSPMPLPGRNDELRNLGQSVNQMTERLRQLQETVQQTERVRLLGQVGGGLAHQLRNGVTGARLAVQLHARACDGKGDLEALEVAVRQLDLMEANLKRFLDLGRTESLRREPCSVRSLIDEAVGLLSPQCRHAGTELCWRPGDGDGTLTGDSVQLGHLFLNLITNAVEAAGAGGTVEVTMHGASRDGSSNGKAPGIIVEVSDTGSGPPPDVAARLFQPFVTGKREGIGLGLAVAKQVTEAHGGRIDWRRDNGRTCFRVELPAT
jgi:signal transduction histidine kinase